MTSGFQGPQARSITGKGLESNAKGCQATFNPQPRSGIDVGDVVMQTLCSSHPSYHHSLINNHLTSRILRG